MENPQAQGETVEVLPCSNASSVQGVLVGTQVRRSEQEQVTPSMAETDTSNKLESCTFKRGGMCNLHQIVGTRSTRTSKSWKKKKDGSFGYVTSKKVEYTCKFSNQSNPVNIMGAGFKIPEPDGVMNNGRNYEHSPGLSTNLDGDVNKKDESERKPPDP